MPRPLGSYAVEWEPTEWRDEVLGPLGGAFHGTVMEFKPGREFFVADLYWLPPDGDPIGPMALEATCTAAGRLGAAARAPVRLRRDEPALDAVLRHRVGELGVGARGAEEVPGRSLGVDRWGRGSFLEDTVR